MISPQQKVWLSCGVYACGKFCGNLKVYRPSERQVANLHTVTLFFLVRLREKGI